MIYIKIRLYPSIWSFNWGLITLIKWRYAWDEYLLKYDLFEQQTLNYEIILIIYVIYVF